MPSACDKISTIVSTLANGSYVDILATMSPEEAEKLGGTNFFMHETIHQLRKIVEIARSGHYELVLAALPRAYANLDNMFLRYLRMDNPSIKAEEAGYLLTAPLEELPRISQLRQDSVIAATLLDTHEALVKVEAIAKEAA